MVLFTQAMYTKLDLVVDVHYYLLLASGIFICFAWCFSAFLAQMLAESLTWQFEKLTFYKATKSKILRQRQVSDILTDLLLVYFSIFQILSITLIFTSISKFLITEKITPTDIYNFIGTLLLEASFVLNIHAMVSSFELVYSHFDDLTITVQTCLENSIEKLDRRKWKRLLRQLSLVKPFSARGYFDITKETITSMASVR